MFAENPLSFSGKNDLTDEFSCSSREPSAVSFISPKVTTLCQKDDGQCDRAVSAETRCEFMCCSPFFLSL